MMDLLNKIGNMLDTLSIEIYLRNQVPQGATFPYVEYVIINNSMLEQRTDNILEIDIWTNKSKNGYDAFTDIENTTDSIEDIFNFERIITDTFQASFDKLARLNIPDIDKNILRRQLRYRIRTFSKGGKCNENL